MRRDKNKAIVFVTDVRHALGTCPYFRAIPHFIRRVAESHLKAVFLFLAVLSFSAQGWENDLEGTWRLSGSKLCSDGNEIADSYFHIMEFLIANHKYVIADEDDGKNLKLEFTFASLFPFSMEYMLLNDENEEGVGPRFLARPVDFAREEYGSHDFYIEKTGEDSLTAFFADEMNFCEGDFVLSYFIREKHTVRNHPAEGTAYP